MLAPENTLAGLVAAAQCGCTAVEFDVMLTADGVPVLMHDETLERTTRCAGRVTDLTLAQIRACDASVPTLAEAIAECRRLWLWANIELKPASGHETETGAIVGQWLAAHWDGHGVISSFSKNSALAGRQYLPGAAFALLYEYLPAQPDEWHQDCQRLGACAIHLAAAHVDVATASCLNAADMPWACYTVDTLEDAERLFGMGCAAIFTDRPDLWCPD